MKKITLNLTLDQAQTVLNGLSKLPYEQSAVVIGEIQKQAAEQMKDPAVVTPAIESSGNAPS